MARTAGPVPGFRPRFRNLKYEADHITSRSKLQETTIFGADITGLVSVLVIFSKNYQF
jgi:hypothetical protein